MKKQAVEIRRATGATRLVFEVQTGTGRYGSSAARPAPREREPMKTARVLRSAVLALVLAAAAPAGAKDVYKAFLDPGNPQHKATLDILAQLEQTPNDAGLHNDLGCLIARDGFWRDALREFDTGREARPEGRDAPYFNAGLVQTTRGEWGAARGARSRRP